MKTQTNITPPPYHLKRIGRELYIESNEGFIADMQRSDAISMDALAECEETAAYIVKACNSHEQLVGALAAIVSQAQAQFNAGDKYATFNRQTIDSIKTALSQAQA